MADSEIAITADTDLPRSVRARARKLLLLPLLILVTFGGLGVLADVVAPYPPNKIALRSRLLPPFWQGRRQADASPGHGPAGPGHDQPHHPRRAGLHCRRPGGRSRRGYHRHPAGAHLSGYYGRWADTLIMRTTDAMLSLPIILIALLFAVVFGPQFQEPHPGSGPGHVGEVRPPPCGARC